MVGARRRMVPGAFALVLAGLSLAGLVLAGAALACTNLAALNLSTSAGRVDDAVTVTGSGFGGGMDLLGMEGMPMGADGMEGMAGMSGMGGMEGMPGMEGMAMGPVAVHWGAEGWILARATPDASGNFSLTITVPAVEPGHYVILATEKNAEGIDKYGTPARASFEVLTASGRRVTPATGSATAGSDGPSTGMMALTVGLGVLGLGLLGGGTVAVARQVGRRQARVEVAGRRE